RDAPPGTASDLAIPADEECRSPVALHEPRGHDPDDTWMPPLRREYQGAVLRPQRRLGQGHRFIEDPLIHRLAPGVQGLQLTRNPRRLGGIVGQEQAEAVPRLADAAGGIEPWREDESHVA